MNLEQIKTKLSALIRVLEWNLSIKSLEILPQLKEIEKELNEMGVGKVQENAKVEKAKEVIQAKKEEAIDQEVFNRAKEYLKEKGYKGYGLLKGQNMITKALDNGFTI